MSGTNYHTPYVTKPRHSSYTALAGLGTMGGWSRAVSYKDKIEKVLKRALRSSGVSTQIRDIVSINRIAARFLLANEKRQLSALISKCTKELPLLPVLFGSPIRRLRLKPQVAIASFLVVDYESSRVHQILLHGCWICACVQGFCDDCDIEAVEQLLSLVPAWWL